MNKRMILGLALAGLSALLFAEGNSPLLKPHPAEPLPNAQAKQAGDQAPAAKAGKASPSGKVATKKAQRAQGKIVAIAPRGKASKFSRVTLELKGGKKMSIDVANAMVASHRLKTGERVKISYKVEGGKKLATRIAS